MIVAERARALVREAGGAELLERLDHLDAKGAERPTAPPPPLQPDSSARIDFDVVIAGGGLWSLLAPILAARGLSVAVLDRARVAQAHREWNASGPELQALVRTGIVDQTTLAGLVLARTSKGVCRFAGGGQYWVRGVLDHSVDAGALLAAGRALMQRRGVRVLDHHSLVSQKAGPDGIAVRVRSPGAEIDLVARWLVDARGASSPDATADLVCPTVGGVVEGLSEGDADDEMNPEHGDILATIDGVENGLQHVWEAFPGRPGQTTIYLFHYARARERPRLAQLYGRFFAKLPGYKRGAARLVRPTFGLIPGWSRLCPAPRASDSRVVLVGDTAARHSPLTCCGFGSALRSLDRAATALVNAVRDPHASCRDLECIVDDAPAHAVTGALALVMASRTFKGHELNQLLDAAFLSLSKLGEDHYASLLRDELSPREVLRFLTRTAATHPQVWRRVVSVLGPLSAGRWALGVAGAVRAARRNSQGPNSNP